MDPGSLIIGLGGLATGAWAAYLTSRSRTQTLREALYQRQMDLFVDLITAASDLHGEVGSIIDAGGGDPQRRAVAKLVEVSQRHWPVNARLAAFAPAPVFAAWKRIDSLVLNSIADSNDRVALQRDFDAFEGAIGDLLQHIRGYLGTEPLTEETKSLIGSKVVSRRS